MIANFIFLKREKVTLKIEIPHKLHSNVIGKSGKNTKNIMNITECHIHFPDKFANCSTKCSSTHPGNSLNCDEDEYDCSHPKLNQVSISGPAENVERARAELRV